MQGGCLRLVLGLLPLWNYVTSICILGVVVYCAGLVNRLGQMEQTPHWGDHVHTLHVSFLPELHYNSIVELAVEENAEVGRGVVQLRSQHVRPTHLQSDQGLPVFSCMPCPEPQVVADAASCFTVRA